MQARGLVCSASGRLDHPTDLGFREPSPNDDPPFGSKDDRGRTREWRVFPVGHEGTDEVTTIPEMRSTGSAYAVEGLTCGACLAKLIEAVHLLPYVTGVAADLVVDGRSHLMIEADRPVGVETVLACVEEAGFRGWRTGGRQARHLQRTFTRRARPLHGTQQL